MTSGNHTLRSPIGNYTPISDDTHRKCLHTLCYVSAKSLSIQSCLRMQFETPLECMLLADIRLSLVLLPFITCTDISYRRQLRQPIRYLVNMKAVNYFHFQRHARYSRKLDCYNVPTTQNVCHRVGGDARLTVPHILVYSIYYKKPLSVIILLLIGAKDNGKRYRTNFHSPQAPRAVVIA